MVILTSKAFTSDHLAYVQCTNSTSMYSTRIYSVHIIRVFVQVHYVFLYMLFPSRRELIEYSSILTTELRAHVNVRNSKVST